MGNYFLIHVQWLSQEEPEEHSPLQSVPALFKKILTVFHQTAVFVLMLY